MFKYFWVVFSFEWLFASVAAKVREESLILTETSSTPLDFPSPTPAAGRWSHSRGVSLYFTFFTSSFLPLYSLLQGPSIYCWQLDMNIALKECRGQENIWDCAGSSPHPTACTLWQTAIQKSILGQNPPSILIYPFFLLTVQRANIAVPHVNLFKLHLFTQGKMAISLA